MADLSAVVQESLLLLKAELTRDQPSVARASCTLGTLQDWLFNCPDPGTSFQESVDVYVTRFHDQLVLPAARQLAKCRRTEDKILAVAKFLRGRLAKAPAHKQPLHTQYLPSALRSSGKRQLDCLGIATAVLAMCHAIANLEPPQHADLAHCQMTVSDDHCWISLPRQTDLTGAAGDEPRLHVEVTDPRLLEPPHMANWLYAGGPGGQSCTAAQVVLVLVGGLMPEEIKDSTAADQLRKVQMHLLQQLAENFPHALLYSTFFRWGMLHEELELAELAAAAESGNMQQLQLLAMLKPQQLASQQQYATAQQRSKGWQWHPSSCATFGWLNRMQAALCGETDQLLALQQPASSTAGEAGEGAGGGVQQSSAPDHQKQQCDRDNEDQQMQSQHFILQQDQRQGKQVAEQSHKTQQHEQQQRGPAAAGPCLGQQQQQVPAWVSMAVSLLLNALAALQQCTAVLRQYSNCASKPDRSADQQLIEAVSDLWGNLADASKAVACLLLQQQQQQQMLQYVAAVDLPPATHEMLQEQQGSSTSRSRQVLTAPQAPQALGTHAGSSAAAAAAAAGPGKHRAHCEEAAFSSVMLTNLIRDGDLLLPQLLFMDALCMYFGDESADLPPEAVKNFLTAASCFTRDARAAAAARAVQQQQLFSARLRTFAQADTPAGLAWLEMAADLQHLVQVPTSRKRKRKDL